jgi:hypothetical protein
LFWLLKCIQTYRIKKALLSACDAIAVLNNAFFDGYIKREDLIKQSYNLYHKQVKVIKAFQHVRYLVNNDDVFGNALIHIEHLHEVVCSLHLLRFRFDEFALFEVCFHEMQNLKKTSTILFYKIKRKNQSESISRAAEEFEGAIQAFENLYGNTLQVVARDPMGFQFFIQDLYVLHVLMTAQL